MLRSLEGDIFIENEPTLSKDDIRSKVWNYIEQNNLANFPRPVTRRIPNFKGAEEAAQKLRDLEEFADARVIKVNPDKPQASVCLFSLEAKKTVLVPTPQLRTGLFKKLECKEDDVNENLQQVAQSKGLKKFATPVGLEDMARVDLIVVGSVAVSQSGYRIGKGKGFDDLEYAMMKVTGSVDDSVLIVTTVHDCQVFDELPPELFKKYDIPVDIIVTPQNIFRIKDCLPRPEGIYWDELKSEQFKAIPVLRELWEMEKCEGKEIHLQNAEEPPTKEEIEKALSRQGRRGRGRFRTFYRGRGRGRGVRTFEELDEDIYLNGEPAKNIQVTINVSKRNKIGYRSVEEGDTDAVSSAVTNESLTLNNRQPFRKRFTTPISYSVFIGRVPNMCRFRDLKEELEKREVHPADITWRYRHHFALLHFSEGSPSCEAILEALQGLSLKKKPVVVEKAKPRELHARQPGQFSDNRGSEEDSIDIVANRGAGESKDGEVNAPASSGQSPATDPPVSPPGKPNDQSDQPEIQDSSEKSPVS